MLDRLTKKVYGTGAIETPTICDQDLPIPGENVTATLAELGCSVRDDLIALEHRGFDILRGSDRYWECVTETIRQLRGSLTVVETVFGWAARGWTG